MKMIKIPIFTNEMPSNPDAWINEIAKAYLDAAETIPFGKYFGKKLTPDNLFHLGPLLCLKFRGIKRTNANLKKAADAALASYVSTKASVGNLFDIPQMTFAFSYVASHFGLDLLSEQECAELLGYLESNINQLTKMTEK